MSDSDQNGLPEDRIPEELIERLERSERRGRVLVPPDVDAAVLGRARIHLRRAAWRRGLGKKSTPWLAAAALLVATLLIFQPGVTSRKAPVAEDLDHNGRVDIRDALVLARKIEQGGMKGAEFDLNGDGAVDGRDVDLVAKRAVRLGKGERS